MSRLLIPNTTQVPNVLLDEVIPTLKPAAVRILLAIVRFTYGFGKPADRISFTRLAKVTGLSRWGVNGAVDELRAREIIIVKPGAKGRGANEYSLNLDISTGQLVRNNDQSYNLTSQVGSQLSRLSQTNSKPKKRERTESDKQIPDSLSHKRSRKLTCPDPAATDPRIKPFLSWFAEEYEKRFGAPYAISWGKDGRRIKELSPAFDLPRLKDLATRFFESEDPWVRENGGFTIGVFMSQINKLASTANGNGHAEPAKVKDLGDGWLEVDGRRMDRATYERRYGQTER